MSIQHWIVGCVFATCLALGQCQDEFQPAIAMVCGKSTQHRDVSTGKWITDPSGSTDCMTDIAEMLVYCREVYPDLNIESVSKESDAVKINSWCALGHRGPHCKGHSHTVAPVRCVVARNSNPDLDPVCLLPRKVGLCRAAFSLWYFSSASGACEPFIYGGCGGNENRFETEDACKKRCTPTNTISKDPVLNVPLLTGLGPVMLDDDDVETTTETTTTTSTPLASTASDAAQSSESYFDAPLDPDNEHEMYVQSRLQELKNHQGKLAKATSEWDSAKDQLLKSGAPQTELDQLDANYQSTVDALTNEHQQKQDQLSSMHQARVDAYIVSNRQSAYNDFTSSLAAANPVASPVIRTFRHYLKSEQRDQKHIISHFNMDLEAGGEAAENSQARLQDRLDDMQERVNNALALVREHPDLYSQIEDRLSELRDDVLPPVTLQLTDDDDVYDDEPIRIDNGGLPAENTDDMEVIDLDDETDDVIEDDDDDEFDVDDELVAMETPAPLDPGLYETDEEFQEEEDFINDLNNPDNFGVVPDMADIKLDDLELDPPAMVYDTPPPDYDDSSEFSWLAWVGIVGAFMLILLAAFGSARMVQSRNAHRRQFARVQVDDHLTAEERQLLQMQQNGYENPTYKFFEKQQLRQA